VLLEKAWSKLNGNYLNSEGGYNSWSLRSLLGVPTISYNIYSLKTQYDLDYIWDEFEEMQRTLGILHITSTDSGADNTVNNCGMTLSHAFPIISLFPLKDILGNISHRMLMIRDPRGTRAHTASTKKWNVNDTISWNPYYK